MLRQRKKEMKRRVHRSLLPLYFHMRDQSESVAKVQISELSSYVGKGVLMPQGCSGGSLAGSMSCLRWWLSRGLALATEPSARCPSHGCTRVRQHPGVSPSDVTMGAHPAQARVTVAPIVTSLGDTPGLRLIRAQPWLGPSGPASQDVAEHRSLMGSRE